MSNTYIGLTIGPIYKTFQNVRRTRELWASSFCFSFLMRNINKQLREHEKGIKSEDFILPYFEKKESAALFKLKGYGFFPDRLIFKSKDGDIDLLIDSIDKAFDLLYVVVEKVLLQNSETEKEIPPNKVDIVVFLKNYFQISYIEKSLDEPDKSNIILELSPYLDTLEQQNKFLSKEPYPNYLYSFFNRVNNRKNKLANSFLDENYEIRDINGTIRVESLIEIATRELKVIPNYRKIVNHNLWDSEKEKDIDSDNQGKASDTKFLEALLNECATLYPKEDENPFRSYQKYYCIVQADGDKMGAALKQLKSDIEVQEFSNHLTNWARNTYKAVKEQYDGVPIYIGGDDLLCIVPVCNGKENVFDLIRKIDKIFNDEFTNDIPTLSFGLSITYYKYPLAEAFVKAYDLLKKAKKEGGNRIVAQIIKHSGNEMISVFDKSSELYRQTLLDFLNLQNLKESSNSSITYKLRENEKVFKEIGLLPDRVKQFINHLTDSKDVGEGETGFNDLDKAEKFMRLVKDTIIRVYKEKAKEVVNQNMEKISEAAMKEIYSTLRIVKFVKGLDDDKS